MTPARITTEQSSPDTMLAAHSLGVTRRWIGLMPMTSIAASSSRMLRAPMSAVMADPPTPETSSAAASGATCWIIAAVSSAPVPDCAPSCRAMSPT